VTDVDPRWYDGFFEGGWLDYVQPEHDVTLRQVDFLVEELALAPRNSVLDVACGRGRHSVELARRGFRVTGVDLSPRSLELARAPADKAGTVVELRRLDMRELDYDGVFDAVINLFTAFGYFREDVDNERVVQRIATALRPGGRFLLDTINPVALARVLRERDWHEHSVRAYVPGELLIFLRRAGLDIERAWGSFDRTELGDGTRTILLACKP
jgi:SAM-dependent methyltransferase